MSRCLSEREKAQKTILRETRARWIYYINVQKYFSCHSDVNPVLVKRRMRRERRVLPTAGVLLLPAGFRLLRRPLFARWVPSRRNNTNNKYFWLFLLIWSVEKGVRADYKVCSRVRTSKGQKAGRLSFLLQPRELRAGRNKLLCCRILTLLSLHSNFLQINLDANECAENFCPHAVPPHSVGGSRPAALQLQNAHAWI